MLNTSQLKPNCYQLLPKKQISVPDAIPSTWLNELIDLCAKNSADKKWFAKHIGLNSTYTHKGEILTALKQFYLILTEQHNVLNLSTNQRSVLINKLTDDVSQCTPGFHIRLEDILKDVHAPRTIDEMLMSFRIALVERLARTNCKKMEIHTYNGYFTVAHALNYGVHPIVEKDPFTYTLQIKERISKPLQEFFNKLYQPLDILWEIKKTLQEKFHYRGALNDDIGYQVVDYEQGVELLQSIFNTTDANYANIFITKPTKDADIISDINWDYILNALWQKLSSNYFNLTPQQSYNIEMALKSPIANKARQWACFIKSAIKIDNNILLSTHGVLCYFHIISHKQLTSKQQLDIIFASIKNAAKSQEVPNFFWSYAAQTPALTDEFVHRFTTQYTPRETPQKLLKQLSASKGTFAPGIMLKTSLLTLEQKQKLFFTLKTKKNKNGLNLIITYYPKGLDLVLNCIPHHQVFSILNKQLQIHDVLIKSLKPYHRILLNVNCSSIENINTLNMIFLHNHSLNTLHDLSALYHDLGFIFKAILYILILCGTSGQLDTYKILSIITLVGLINIVNAETLYTFHTLLNKDMADLHFEHLNLLPQVVGLIYNNQISHEESRHLFNPPPAFIDKEAQKYHGEIKLALSLVKFSALIDIDTSDAWSSDKKIHLKNSLASSLSIYTNSKKTNTDKMLLKNNWINACEQARAPEQSIINHLKKTSFNLFCMLSPIGLILLSVHYSRLSVGLTGLGLLSDQVHKVYKNGVRNHFFTSSQNIQLNELEDVVNKEMIVRNI